MLPTVPGTYPKPYLRAAIYIDSSNSETSGLTLCSATRQTVLSCRVSRRLLIHSRLLSLASLAADSRVSQSISSNVPSDRPSLIGQLWSRSSKPNIPKYGVIITSAVLSTSGYYLFDVSTMSVASARWSMLSKVASKARSSHCVSITHDGLLIMYGGELEPRKPVDTGADEISQALPGSLHTFDLKDKSQSIEKSWTTHTPRIQPSASDSEAFPQPRVGATTAWDKSTNSLYLWGGRGGVSMAPLDKASAGPWKAHLSPRGVEWQRLVVVSEDESPEPRSYHGSVLIDVCMNTEYSPTVPLTFGPPQGKLYIHAGCPESGRLSTLHSFDLSSNCWKSLTSAPDPARGGVGLAAVRLPDQGAAILRFGGKHIPSCGEH